MTYHTKNPLLAQPREELQRSLVRVVRSTVKLQEQCPVQVDPLTHGKVLGGLPQARSREVGASWTPREDPVEVQQLPGEHQQRVRGDSGEEPVVKETGGGEKERTCLESGRG